VEILDAKITQKSPSAYHPITLSGYIFATKACIDNQKNLLNGNTSSICRHFMLNFGLLMAEICWRVWGTRSKFQWVLRLGLVTALTLPNRCQPNFARCLAVSCAGILCINFGGLLPRNGILPAVKFTLRPSLAFSDIGSVTAQHSSTRRQPNFVVLSRGHHLYSAGQPSSWESAHILVNVCLHFHN